MVKETPNNNNPEQIQREKEVIMTFEEAVESIVREGLKENAAEGVSPRLIALYGSPDSGKTRFFQKICEKLSQNEDQSLSTFLIHTSDSPETDLKSYEQTKERYPEKKFPFIFFHEISLGAVDNFTLEKFEKCADKSLLIFNPHKGELDPVGAAASLKKFRELYADLHKMPRPAKTDIIFISNPDAKDKIKK